MKIINYVIVYNVPNCVKKRFIVERHCTLPNARNILVYSRKIKLAMKRIN